MTGITRDLLGFLRGLVARETRYLRHYLGEVRDVDDPLVRGRVLVRVPELGWNENSTAAWCWPRERHAMDLPRVGEWVEVYFMAGDPARPVYLGQAGEIRDQAPADHDGKLRVLFQDPDSGDALEYDPGAGLFLLGGDAKKLVTHAELDSALQGLVSWINGHVHPTAATGPPSAPTPPLASLDISSAEAVKLRTK